MPTINTIFKNSNDLKVGNKKLTVLTQKANDLSLLDSNELKSRFDILNTAVPSEKDVPSLMVGIERIAKEASVSVGLLNINAGSLATGSASVDKSKKVNPLNSIVANVTIKGSLSNIISFISKVTNGRRLLKIQGINLGSMDAQKANSNISMVLIIHVYYQALPSNLGDISQPLSKITDDESIYYDKIKNYPLYTTIQSSNQNVSLPEEGGSNLVPVGKTDLFSR